MKPLLLPALGTLLLLALASAIGLQFRQVFWSHQPLPAKTDPDPVVRTTLASAATLPSPHPSDYYAAITDRPLFAPGRKPERQEEGAPAPIAATAPAAPSAPEPPPEPPTLRLFGTLDTGLTASALIGATGTIPNWVGRGKSIGEWRVAKVGPDWVELSNNDKTLRLEMYPK